MTIATEQVALDARTCRGLKPFDVGLVRAREVRGVKVTNCRLVPGANHSMQLVARAPAINAEHILRQLLKNLCIFPAVGVAVIRHIQEHAHGNVVGNVVDIFLE